MDAWTAVAAFALGLLVLIWLMRLFGIVFAPQSGAKKVQADLESVYGGPHEFRSAAPAEFPHVPTQFYDEMQAWFESRGFRTLGDIEDMTLSNTYPNLRTFLRVFLSGDGAIMAACYDVRPKGWIKLLQKFNLIQSDFRTVDLETEFNDGTFLAVSNSEGRDEFSESPGERKIQLPPDTPVAEMLELHRAIIAKWQGEDNTYRPKTMLKLEDVIASQHRLQALKNTHRQQIGYISKEEMDRIAGAELKENGTELLRELRNIQAGQKTIPRP